MKLLVILALFGAASIPVVHAGVELVATLRPADASAAAKIDELFQAISTPGSEEYLKFLSREQIRLLVASDAQSISTTEAWLRNAGADQIVVSPLGDHVRGIFSNGVEGLGPTVERPAAVAFVLRRDTDAMPLSAVPKVRQSKATATAAGYNVASVKRAFGIPTDLKATNASTLQMVWGPGTFGYSETQLLEFKMTQCPLLNMKAISFDTKNHGKAGGDNYGEGNLDVSMIASYGLNVNTIVSNTNVSSSTEEGTGFGQAMLDFLIDLPTRATIPQVLSISLGSLSAYSCDLLCTEAVKMGHSAESCHSFMQSQRQVCMYMSEYQTDLIDTAFKLLAMRGVTVFGSSGDGGSHWSFEAFPSGTSLGRDLNTIGCKFQFPVYPTGSPYVTSVGGITWGDSPADPIAWDRSGGGFAWQFPRASFQDDAVTSYLKTAPGLPPFTSFNQSNRAYPDISAISLDGTSQSSPMVAGIFSLLMDYRLNQGLPPLGFLGPRLYQTMAKYPNEAFKDVTDGNSKTSCDNGFPATRGWDPVTGWGSPLWQGIKEHFGTDSNIVKLGL